MSLEKDRFFEVMESQGLALTFADVSIQTMASDVGESDTSLASNFSRNVDLKLPFVSAAMNTVTESRMAIAMAQLGGIGIIHAGLEPREQRNQVREVKFELNPVISNPITFVKNRTIESIQAECSDRGFAFRTFPVVDEEENVVGLLTQNDFDLAKRRSGTLTAEDAMTVTADLTFGDPDTTPQQAYSLMEESGKKTIPLLAPDGKIAGLYLWSELDLVLSGDYSKYNVDESGRLRVGAAIPSGDQGLERVDMMGDYPDVIVIDSSTGDKKYARDTLKEIKRISNVDVVIGNISSSDSVKLLINDGADGIKVGQGPGAICTTQEELGYGKPQLTAIFECAKAARGSGIPICADGGISTRGHISKAIAAGADSVMMGRMLAATEETPGEVVTERGIRGKYFTGMGAKETMANSAAAKDRYGNLGKSNPLPQGVKSFVPLEGSVVDKIDKAEQALRGSMSGCNSADISEHQQNTRFDRRTQNAVAEARPHDVEVIAD